MRLFFWGALIICSHFSCIDKANTSLPDKDKEISSSLKDKDHQLIIDQAPALLKVEPGLNSSMIQELPLGTVVYDLEEVSPFLATMTLHQKVYRSPWLKVELKDKSKGWLFAANVKPYQSVVNKKHFLEEKILLSILGNDLKELLEGYKSVFEEIYSIDQFKEAFLFEQSLKDSLNQLFNYRIETSIEQEELSVLNSRIPSIVSQWVPIEKKFFFFSDYKLWQEKAALTKNPLDDRFIATCQYIYSIDSIEYIYPAWVLPTSDTKLYSLLGRGIHFEALKRMSHIFGSGAWFQKEIIVLKNALVDDICNPEGAFWENQAKVVLEMDTILNTSFPILSKADRIALESRREQFNHPEKYQIIFNYRSGQYAQ